MQQPERERLAMYFTLTFFQDLRTKYFFTPSIVLSDEATFHLPENDDRHNLRIWGCNSPHENIKCTRDSPELGSLPGHSRCPH